MTNVAPAESHPAKYSAGMVEHFADLIEWWRSNDSDITHVADPMAGHGGIFPLEALADVTCHALEIEPRFAAMHPRTIVHDSTTAWPDTIPDQVDAVITSPTYGNRMGDTYLPPESDRSKRMTYTVANGAPLHRNNTGRINRLNGDYRLLHAMIVARIAERVRPGGHVVINVKDSAPKTGRNWVADYWLSEAMTIEGPQGRLFMFDECATFTAAKGNRMSPTRQRLREQILTFRRTEHPAR